MYSANITSGGLLLHESRVIAGLILDGTPIENLPEKIKKSNILQKRSPETARKMLSLVLSRISHLQPRFLLFIKTGTAEEVSLFLLALCADTHRLIGDFLLFIRRECLAQYRTELSLRDWDHYFTQCISLQPDMEMWTDSTRKKLRSTMMSMLVSAGIIQKKTGNFLTPYFSPLLSEYLDLPENLYPRLCMEGFRL